MAFYFPRQLNLLPLSENLEIRNPLAREIERQDLAGCAPHQKGKAGYSPHQKESRHATLLSSPDCSFAQIGGALYYHWVSSILTTARIFGCWV